MPDYTIKEGTNFTKQIYIGNTAFPVVLPIAPTKYGARYWLLMSISFLCIVRGLIYIAVASDKVDIPAGLTSLSPSWIHFYGVGWIISAGICVVSAIVRRWWPPVFAAAASPSFVWSAAYFYTAHVTGDQSWNGGLIYLALVSIIFWALMVPPARGWSGR